jgi:hypothetical protein
MDTRVAIAATPVSLLRSFVPVKSGNGKRRASMTTEYIEAYAMEEQDQIFVNGSVYKMYVGIDPTDEGYRFRLIDEEGDVRYLTVEDTEKLPLVVDILAQV